jgi:C-terminal processing protease CtpA/Prc
VPSLPLSAASYIVVKESTGPIGLSLAKPNHDRLQTSNNHPITIVEVKPNTPAARSVPPLAAGMRIVGINGIPVPADVHTAAERISQLGRGKMTLEVLPGATPAERRSWISR